MLFSIIVPVYNTEKYLKNCLESILNQTFRDYELIVVNDGSKDSSAEICDYYAQLDDRIRVIHKENGGVSSARNCGINMAKGKYIWFVDSDDTIANNALQILSAAVKDNDDLIVFNRLLEEKYHIKSFDDFLKVHYFSYHLGFEPWNKLYKREIIKLNNILFDTEEAIGEDLLFNISYYQYINNIKFISEKLYNYIVREDSAMTTRDDKRYIKQMRLFDKIRDLISNDISENSLTCLYFMHLISGLNQTSNGQLSMKDRIKTAQEYQRKYNWNRDIYQKGLRTFLINERAGLLGKIRTQLMYGYWSVGDKRD